MAFSYTCREAGLDCDFLVQSEDRDELLDLVEQHVDRSHDGQLSREAIEAATVTIRF